VRNISSTKVVWELPIIIIDNISISLKGTVFKVKNFLVWFSLPTCLAIKTGVSPCLDFKHVSITVFIRTSPFQNKGIIYTNSKTIDFPIATNNSIEIVKNALTGLDLIYKDGFKYQKAGIILSGLSDSEKGNSLFKSTKDERIKNLMQSIDNTNYRYGRSTISLASAGINKKWSMRRQYSSKIDTADFYSLPKILAN